MGKLAPCLILICAVLVTLPLVRYGPSCGHDFDFHLQSWLAANADWRSGLLAPHWVPAANYGAGEPRFVFYPPLSWALGAALGLLLPWTLVPQAFTVLVLAACGLAFYRLACRWVRPAVAAGAACVYLANPYMLFVTYERTAYGELMAAAAMPLVVLYALQTRPPVARLALVIAALWLTNAPSAVMGCYLLGLCAVIAAGVTRSLQPLGRSLGALVLGTGAACVYVLPAWYEQRWVEIARVVGPGMRVEDSFLFGHTGEAFHDQVLHTASSIAVVILDAGLLFSALSRAHGSHTTESKLPRLLAAMALGLILLLQLPLSEPVWRLAPELRFLQFPWRWLMVGSLLATLAFALVADSVTQRMRGRWLLLAAALVCLAAFAAGRYAEAHFAQYCDDEDNVRAQQALLPPSSLAADPPGAFGFEGTDEYTPTGADNGEIQQGLPAVRLLPSPDADEGDDAAAPNPDWQPSHPLADTVQIDQWQPEQKRLRIQSATPGFAVLRLEDYPAWQVLDDDRPVALRPHREDGLLTIPYAAGRTTIEVRWRATPDVWAGRALSLLSLAALGGWSLRRRRV